MNDLDIPENILGSCFDNNEGALDDLNLDADLNKHEPNQAANSDFSAKNSAVSYTHLTLPTKAKL